MKIAIFGGTGSTGQEIIKQALERNHLVTALVRNPAAITQTSPNLTVIVGNVFDADTVEKAILGNDVVLSVLGSKGGRAATTIYSDSARTFIAAMTKTGVKRLIYCTSAGTEDDDPSEMFVYRHLIKPFFLQMSYDDMKVAEALIRSSHLDWILVRPSLLTNGPRTTQFRASAHYRPEHGTRISRADVAYFMVEQITRAEWVRKTPTLAY